VLKRFKKHLIFPAEAVEYASLLTEVGGEKVD
jgi:hypothetical protein